MWVQHVENGVGRARHVKIRENYQRQKKFSPLTVKNVSWNINETK